MGNFTNNEAKIFPTTEVVGALLSDKCSNDVDFARMVNDDIQGTILSNFNVDTSALDLSLVSNTSDEVNLVLPYYTQVESIAACEIGDGHLDGVSGGEIIFLILGCFASVFGTIGAACGIGSGIGASVVVGALVTGGLTGATVAAAGAGGAGGVAAIVGGAAIVGAAAAGGAAVTGAAVTGGVVGSK